MTKFVNLFQKQIASLTKPRSRLYYMLAEIADDRVEAFQLCSVLYFGDDEYVDEILSDRRIRYTESLSCGVFPVFVKN